MQSKDWSEVVSTSETSLTTERISHNHPLGGGASFGLTFWMMFKEEWRENLDFARKRHLLLFPALLAIISLVAVVGLPFLVGESAAQTEDIERKTFSWDAMRLALHIPLFMFSLGMGSFAFLGREVVLSRAGTRNYLLASPALQPISVRVAHMAYFVKDLLFYVMMILTPIIGGMAVALILKSFGIISTPLLWSSLPWTWLAMITTLGQGLALSFIGSALFLRGGWTARITPLVVIFIATSFILGLLPTKFGLLGLAVQNQISILLFPLAMAISLLIAWIASWLVPEDFENHVSQRKEMFQPIHSRLGFIRNPTTRLLVGKEFVDLFRSGSIKKMTISYAIPLCVLLMLAWLVDFAEAPIPINLLTYAPFLGFFGFNFYSWLTALDEPDHMNGLPLTVPQLIRAKVVVYLLATSWISLIFLILMAWQLDAWMSLPVALVVMFANSIYIVALTAFLMGLKPNKAIFDASIMIWFWIGTVIPLLVLFLLSFTQGDASLYSNWYGQVSESGLDAQAQEFDNSRMQSGFTGILVTSGLLLFGATVLWFLLDRRWSKAEFSN